MVNTTLITVIIPTFNRAGLLERAVTSVLSQTHQNLEIIIVDNASTDNTAQVVSSFIDKRIKFVRHDVNKGPAASRNTGIMNARGEFIAFLDSDDEWLPEKISMQIEIFKDSKEKIGLIFTNGYSEAEKRSFLKEDMPSGIIYDPMRDKFYPLRLLISPPSSWMLPMDIAREIGYFDERMYTWDDGDYLARIAYKYPLYFLNENLVIWHLLETHLNVISHELIKGKEVFLNKNSIYLKRDRNYLFRFYRALGKDALKFRDNKKARRYLFQALKLRPWDFSTIGKISRALRK